MSKIKRPLLFFHRLHGAVRAPLAKHIQSGYELLLIRQRSRGFARSQHQMRLFFLKPKLIKLERVGVLGDSPNGSVGGGCVADVVKF